MRLATRARHPTRIFSLGSILLLSACTPGDITLSETLHPPKDAYAAVRGQYVAQELVLKTFPQGAMDMDGIPVPMSGGQSGMSHIVLPDSYGLLNTVDFYLNLLAQQGHHNLVVGCNQGYDSINLRTAAWNGTYGYFVRVDLYRSTTARSSEPTPVPEIGVNINVTSRIDMPPPTPEVPIDFCPDYPLTRMAKILAPYGLRPHDDPNYVAYYGPGGAPEPRRTTPPFTWPTTTVP
jgi:hypothetical protein